MDHYLARHVNSRLQTRQVTAGEAAAIRQALSIAAMHARAYATAPAATGLTFEGAPLGIHLALHDEEHCAIATGETYRAAVARLSKQGFPYMVMSYKSGNAKSPKLFRSIPKCEIRTQKSSKQFVFHIGTARIRFEAKVDLKKYRGFWTAGNNKEQEAANMRASLNDWSVFTDSTSVKFVGDVTSVSMSKTLATKIAQDYMELVAPVLYITRTGQGAAVKTFAEQPTAQRRLAWALCADALRLCGHSMHNRP